MDGYVFCVSYACSLKIMQSFTTRAHRSQTGSVCSCCPAATIKDEAQAWLKESTMTTTGVYAKLMWRRTPSEGASLL